MFLLLGLSIGLVGLLFVRRAVRNRTRPQHAGVVESECSVAIPGADGKTVPGLEVKLDGGEVARVPRRKAATVGEAITLIRNETGAWEQLAWQKELAIGLGAIAIGLALPGIGYLISVMG